MEQQYWHLLILQSAVDPCPLPPSIAFEFALELGEGQPVKIDQNKPKPEFYFSILDVSENNESIQT